MIFRGVRRMRISAVIAQETKMPVDMGVPVTMTMVMHGYANQRASMTDSVVLESQVHRHQPCLHQQGQADKNSEESLHRLVGWFLLHAPRRVPGPDPSVIGSQQHCA